jgi:hypothetical protein
MTPDKSKVFAVAALVFLLAIGADATSQAVDKAREETVQQTASYWTNITFVNLNKDCATFTSAQFVQAVLANMGWDGVTVTVRVTSIACGSMTVFYQCASTTLGDAVAKCQAARTSFQTLGQGLNSYLSVTRPDIFDPSGTCNNAIYALYTLILLPIFCCAGFLLWYRLKQQQADSQYLQDTATFSNVAARQPQQPYDPSSVVYKSEPVYVAPQPQYVSAPAYTQPIPQFQPMPQYEPSPLYAAPPPVGYGLYPQ